MILLLGSFKKIYRILIAILLPVAFVSVTYPLIFGVDNFDKLFNISFSGGYWVLALFAIVYIEAKLFAKREK